MESKFATRVAWATFAVVALVPVTTAMAGPCADDAARLCPGLKDPKAVVACLRGRDAELTDACRVQLAAQPAKAATVSPCAGDAAKLCPGVPVGHGRVRECLAAHTDSLSPPCRASLSARPTPPCQADAQTLCPGVAAGQGRLRGCLLQNEAKLSPQCAANLKQHAGAVKGAADPCEQDLRERCGGIEAGDARARECLSKHEAELSPACRSSIVQRPLLAWGKACSQDVKKHCAGVSAGEGRITACLKERIADLTPECRQLLGNEP